ncbi:hypothetical protein Ga0466249_004317 [Sporomusaceae bacterium BoRhaA]|uniref:hypothetical protein n=1 Tax=Pelorhabdus rhamnosifermentans TaxID=2772457 RepID=UPI001C061DB8|nr:hypothetical protein [Pelorhabdus rhamnosifermentans]MBU2703181.1 hypothetical protein [Pelorhabdus rhamnosifermentans]
MKPLRDLERIGIDVYLSDKGKLKYRSRQPPDKGAAFLLDELKICKDEVISYLQANRMDAQTAIQQAHDKTLGQAVLIECRPEYAEIWDGPLWLCPDDKAKQQVQQKYPDDFTLSAKEFFDICHLIVADGQQTAVPLIKAMKLFRGSLQTKEVNA